LKVLGLIACVGIVAIGALLASLWIEHRTPLTLPKPTGPFAVGRDVYDWADPHTVDVLAPTPGAKRELLVWIWYPADAQSGRPDDYIPEALRRPAGPLVFRLLTRDLSKVHGHSLRDARVSLQRHAYPVVIMRAGSSLEVATYSTLAEDLASHGYIVVGFDAPYRTFSVAFPDGRIIARAPRNNPELVSGDEFVRRSNKLLAVWTSDIGFVLERLNWLNTSDPSGKFSSRLDMARVGVFGHSFGGAQAAEFCRQDSRCTAGIDIDGALLDGVIREGIRKPFMFLVSGLGDFSSDADVRKFRGDIRSVYQRLPPDGRVWLSIRGANHFTFNDEGALLRSHVIRGVMHLFGQLGIDGRRQLAVTAYCVHTFFDAYLKGPGVSRFSIDSSLYPEVDVVN
jgi:hypothetical protein